MARSASPGGRDRQPRRAGEGGVLPSSAAWAHVVSTIGPSRLTKRAAGVDGGSLSRGVLGPAAVPPLTQALVTLLSAAGFGVLVVALNHAETTPLRSLSIVTGGGAGWATFGILMAAWWRRRLVLSVAAATLALAAAVAAYYVADAVAADSPLAHDFPDLRFWILGALVVGPPLALLGWRARRDDTWLGLVAMTIAPLGFAAESAIYLDGFEWLSPMERAARLTIIGAALAVVAVMVGRKLAGPVDRPGGSLDESASAGGQPVRGSRGR